MWMEKYEQTSTQLAAHLSALTGKKFNVSHMANWANGSSHAVPQWYILMIMCAELDLEISVGPHDVSLSQAE